ncbi:hypothetical protein [Vibrio echinoideorum]|uniref:hypothetical protein n=1 Tax=Vibrio echinoideorum TaxID=2100116 RepID=UPI00354EC0F8
MSYIYCVKITPETQDDVNEKFREQGLEGELFVSQDNEFYVCPQLSHTKWSMFPQSVKSNGEVDSRWSKVIEDTVAYLVSAYDMPEPSEIATWVQFEASYRCSKMESYLRELDLNS